MVFLFSTSTRLLFSHFFSPSRPAVNMELIAMQPLRGRSAKPQPPKANSQPPTAIKKAEMHSIVAHLRKSIFGLIITSKRRQRGS